MPRSDLALVGADFWQAIVVQIDALKSARSADDVIRICPPVPGLSVGDGFFEGGGGDKTVMAALREAGWIVWSEAWYYFVAQAPNGDKITYVEGDIYRGDRMREEGGPG